METLTNTYYKRHLYFEDRPDSKEYNLDKCVKVLAMIAILRDRNQSIRNMSESIYGTSSDGHIKASVEDYNKYNRNKKTIERLKRYYNYCLTRLESFNY